MKNLEAVEKHFKFTISDEWANSHAYYIYEESTADGYSVYIATSDIGNIHVNENVNYYDSDLSDALVEFIRYNFIHPFVKLGGEEQFKMGCIRNTSFIHKFLNRMIIF